MNIIISLCGAKGAGKTTAFNIIKELADVQEITLASFLKNTCAQVLNIPRESFDAQNLKEKDFEDPVYLTPESVVALFAAYGLNPNYDKFVRPHIGKVLHSPRQVAQYVGTEVLRNYLADIHCLAATRGINKEVGVVTDMRFPNEADFFEKTYPQYHSLYIHNMSAEIMAGKDTHASEAYLKDLASRAMYKIDNNAGLTELHAEIKAVLATITTLKV